MAQREPRLVRRAVAHAARRWLHPALAAGAAGLGILTSCAVVETRIYSPGVALADTDEARACYRQCLDLANAGGLACAADSFRQVGEGVYVHERVLTGRYAAQHGCPGMVSDCLLSCPGAKLEGAGPQWVTRTDVVGLPDAYEDDEDDEKPKKKPEPEAVPADAYSPTP